MQQLAWGSPLDLLQSFYAGKEDESQELKPTDKP